MACAVNTVQFALSNRIQTFDVLVPPSSDEHTVSVTVDTTKEVGTIVVYRHSNNVTFRRQDRDLHRPAESDQNFQESFERWQPFSSRNLPASYGSAYDNPLVFHDPGASESSRQPSAAIHVKQEVTIPQRSQGGSFSATPTRPKATQTATDVHCNQPSPNRGNFVYSLGPRYQNACRDSQSSNPVNSANDRHTDRHNDNPNHPLNTHLPFHRRYPRDSADGDQYPELFAVPRHLRERFPPLSTVGKGAAWYAVVSGFEIGVFCDNW